MGWDLGGNIQTREIALNMYTVLYTLAQKSRSVHFKLPYL